MKAKLIACGISQFSSTIQAARLYRHALKTLDSWTIDRDVFNDEADILRARFDANRGLPPAKAIAVIEQGEDELFKFTHPDPYVRPYMPGGSLFMRYSPLPKEVCFPDGDAPDDFPDYTLNPDVSWHCCCSHEKVLITLNALLLISLTFFSLLR